MTIHLTDGRDTFINFCETAPAADTTNIYLDAQGNVKKGASLYGYGAVGVPGTVMGMDLGTVNGAMIDLLVLLRALRVVARRNEAAQAATSSWRFS